MKYKIFIWTWVPIMLIGTLGSQFANLDIDKDLMLWGVLILLGVIITALCCDYKSKRSLSVNWVWSAPILALFILNVLTFKSPLFAPLAQINIYALWSIAISILYLVTSRLVKWNYLLNIGLFSLVLIPLFFIDPLLPYQNYIFGIGEAVLLTLVAIK
jgi:hypothetical protein